MVVAASANTVVNLLNNTTVHNPDAFVRLVHSHPPAVPLLIVISRMSIITEENSKKGSGPYTISRRVVWESRSILIMEVRNDVGVGNLSLEDHAHEQSSRAPSKQVKSSPNTVDTNSVTQRL